MSEGDKKGAQAALAKFKKPDFVIMVLVLILALFGCVMVYSASYYSASLKQGDGAYFFKRQLVGLGLGFAAMLFFRRFDFRRLERLKNVLMIASFVLLLMVFLPSPIGIRVHDSARWVNLGITTVQPAEVAKFTIVIFLASFFAQNRAKLGSFFRGVLPGLIPPIVLCGLIYLQPNFSMLMAIALIMVVMLFCSGAPMRQLITIGGVGVAGVAAAILAEGYRLKRLFVFLDPWANTSSDSYQLIQSFYAIGSGGLFGKGLGMSTQKLLYLPFGESDFIAAIIAEEFGFVGMVLLLGLYTLLVWRGIRIALASTNRFGSMLALGITAMIGIQVIINIAVVTGSMPPTGQTLPFISYGSSSLIIFMSAAGVLMNISKSTAAT